MKPCVHFCAVLMALLCTSTCAQQEKTSFSDLVVLAPKLIRLQNQFEQMVPPGVSIEAREVSRKGTSGKDLEVRYNIYVKGVPPDSTFRQIQWPVDREKPIGGMSGITLNGDGLMICAGRTPEQCHSSMQLDAPVAFAAQGRLRGEPMRFIFTSGNLRIPISFVPDPVQSEDRGCKLSAIRLSAKFELALIEASGFPPDSEVRLRPSNGGTPGVISMFDGKETALTAEAPTGVVQKTDAKGAFQATLLNNTAKNPTGVEALEVTSPGCSPKITYEWGVF
jgi:hypothetical protein